MGLYGLKSITEPSQNKKRNARRQRKKNRRGIEDVDLDTGEELPVNALPELTTELTKELKQNKAFRRNRAT